MALRLFFIRLCRVAPSGTSVSVMLSTVFCLLVALGAAHAAELPQTYVNTSPPEMTGKTISVGAGEDLQQALDAAQRGDTIELQPGAVYRGPFTLPAKQGEGWILITSAGDKLPAAGTRVGPEHEKAMAVLEADRESVLTAAPGAGYYRLVGLSVRPTAGTFLYNLISLGDNADSIDALPHHIVFERCLLRGDPEAGTRRGISLNSRHTAVIDSHLSHFKEVGADSQALAGWNGPGPFKIVNNTLEGAGENIMFGGATSRISGLVPADIEIRGNLLSKPQSWKADHPQFGGKQWSVKNLFELKNARRVLVDGNILEYSWAQAQTGFAVLFTVRSEGGAMPWAVVEDVTFSNNLIRHAGGGINLLGRDNEKAEPGRTRRIVIENNIFEDIGGEWGAGRLFQLLDGTVDVTIRNNTAAQTDSIIVADGAAHSGFVFEGNSAPHNRYGVTGSGSGPGVQTISRYFPDSSFINNAIEGGRIDTYPKGNHFPWSKKDMAKLQDVGADTGRLCAALRDSMQPMPTLKHCGD